MYGVGSREQGAGETLKFVMGNKIKSFEDLEIWQESTALAVEIFKLLKDCKN